MDGFPVVIRTLDPPLHEFLPKREELMVDLALLPYIDAKAKKEMAGRYNITVGELKKRVPELLHRSRSCTSSIHAGVARLPAGHSVSRDHRDAGAGHLRGRGGGGKKA